MYQQHLSTLEVDERLTPRDDRGIFHQERQDDVRATVCDSSDLARDGYAVVSEGLQVLAVVINQRVAKDLMGEAEWNLDHSVGLSKSSTIASNRVGLF